MSPQANIKTKQLVKNIYHVGDNECSVYMVDTQSDQGLVLIDAGMNLDMIRQVSSHGMRFEDIRHCILTHCHIDHIGACAELCRALPGIKFYAHELDAVPIEEPGHDGRTAASWYGVEYEPVKLYEKFESDTILTFGNYQSSMEKLLGLEADILCEGHFGIFQPGNQVRQYIEKHKSLNQP